MSLKTFVNNKGEWDAFCEELDAEIADLHKRLEQSEHIVEIQQQIYLEKKDLNLKNQYF